MKQQFQWGPLPLAIGLAAMMVALPSECTYARGRGGGHFGRGGGFEHGSGRGSCGAAVRRVHRLPFAVCGKKAEVAGQRSDRKGGSGAATLHKRRCRRKQLQGATRFALQVFLKSKLKEQELGYRGTEKR